MFVHSLHNLQEGLYKRASKLQMIYVAYSLFMLAFYLHLLVVSFTVAFLLHAVVRCTQSQSHPESCYAYDFSERSDVDTCGLDDLEDYSVRSCTLEQLLEKLDEFLDFIAHPDSDMQVIGFF